MAASKELTERTVEVLRRASTWVSGAQASELRALSDEHAEVAGLPSVDEENEAEAKALAKAQADLEKQQRAEAKEAAAQAKAEAKDAES